MKRYTRITIALKYCRNILMKSLQRFFHCFNNYAIKCPRKVSDKDYRQMQQIKKLNNKIINQKLLTLNHRTSGFLMKCVDAYYHAKVNQHAVDVKLDSHFRVVLSSLASVYAHTAVGQELKDIEKINRKKGYHPKNPKDL